jgi:5-methyltetrahydrofolate--homocysteine methyltransferase
MVHGADDHIAKDVLELREQSAKSPLEIIEGPLTDGMREVGRRFDEGTMYLPQLIRSARVMKKAVAALEPYMEKTHGDNSPKIVLATVKDDVHDIGKNIVGVILACNGYQIIDLGVSVPTEKIIETAEKEQAAMIGLSGLISPSLDEMINVAKEMEKLRMNIPLLIGGAAASLVHTGLRIDPEYSGPVVYVPNAGKAAETVRILLSDTVRSRFLLELENSYKDAARNHAAIQSRITLLSLEEARANRIPLSPYTAPAPKVTGIIDLNGYPLERVIPYIDWQAFLQKWDHTVTDTVLDDAKALLEKEAGTFSLQGVAGIFPAASDGDDIVIGDQKGDSHHLCFLRSQQKKPAGAYNPCLADFLAPAVNGQPVDWLGLFALSAGFGIEEAASGYKRNNDEYNALLLAALANALAEAFIEEVHLRISRERWGYEEIPPGPQSPHIRPAFGYPACPDHNDKRIAFDLLEAEKRCGMELTASGMIVPAASVCGMFFANPAAYYFGIGNVGDDQLADWAKRKGISVEEARRCT